MWTLIKTGCGPLPFKADTEVQAIEFALRQLNLLGLEPAGALLKTPEGDLHKLGYRGNGDTRRLVLLRLTDPTEAIK